MPYYSGPGWLLSSHHTDPLAPSQIHQGLSTHRPFSWTALPHVLPWVTSSPLRGLCSHVSFLVRPPSLAALFKIITLPPLFVYLLGFTSLHHHAARFICVSSLSMARIRAQGVCVGVGQGRGISICFVLCHTPQDLEQCLVNSRHSIDIYWIHDLIDSYFIGKKTPSQRATAIYITRYHWASMGNIRHCQACRWQIGNLLSLTLNPGILHYAICHCEIQSHGHNDI